MPILSCFRLAMMFFALCSKSKGMGASRARMKSASDIAALLQVRLHLARSSSLPRLLKLLLTDGTHLGDTDAMPGALVPSAVL